MIARSRSVVGRTPTIQSSADAPPDPRQVAYLRDIAAYPFSAALDRDHRLGLSRAEGVRLRSRLGEHGLVRPRRFSTGQRAGQILLLELTADAVPLLEAAGTAVELVSSHDFLRRFLIHQLAEFAARTWPKATTTGPHGPGVSGGAPDLVVGLPAEDGVAARSLAFLIMREAPTHPRTLIRVLERFDEVYLWTQTPRVAVTIQRTLEQRLPALTAGRVRCIPIANCFVDNSTPEPTHANAPQTRSRARRPRARSALTSEFVRAYRYLHDLDRLEESPLITLDMVRERTNRLSAMPEAKALRALLVEGATRAAHDAGEVPTQAPLRYFLDQYLEGKRVTEIAAGLGVTREWCSRAYRRQALELAAMQCERIVAIASSRAPSRRG